MERENALAVVEENGEDVNLQLRVQRNEFKGELRGA
jgi:hypothetical protein